MPMTISQVLAAGTLARGPQPTIEAEGGLLLRPWRDEDVPAVYAAFRDPAIQHWHVRVAESEDEARGWIREWRDGWDGEQRVGWAVATADTDEVVGRMGLRSLSLHEGVAEVAYWVLPAARGAGIAPRAVAALSRWALDEVGFHRLELQHAVGNMASCRVALKSGFALEGTKRSALLHADGWHDSHLHARVQGDRLPGA
ncbi:MULTISPECIES: GNAT family N-acetyltransferase [unclassified Streptomyces]|uniref:GNAT family N-acetyltransferase n=1 Tax=unclassified Streptomyces TaxID=2593676 RepID=UPI002DD81B36|nr:GNAT family N-acetyltransferase [Streptomyces sp. NBC_01445]WSE08304.1 GNAT family N-acetyltransferase [Streptomyces sp. NBC_01445]